MRAFISFIEYNPLIYNSKIKRCFNSDDNAKLKQFSTKDQPASGTVYCRLDGLVVVNENARLPVIVQWVMLNN